MKTLTPAAERLIEAAGDLFYHRGIRAVGVDLIAERAGTTKKTIYDRFGSKDALVSVYLERRMLDWQGFLNTYLDDHNPASGDRTEGVGRVLMVFEALVDWLVTNTRGCGFVNAYGEIGGTDHPGLAVIEAEKTWMRERFTGLCAEAGLPRTLGPQLHLLYEGAVVARTAGGRQQAVAEARTAAASLIKAVESP